MSKLVKIITNIWKQFQTSHKCYLLTIKNCLHLWRKNYSIWMIIFVIVIFLLWNMCWYLSLNGMFLTSFQLLKFMSYEMSKKKFLYWLFKLFNLYSIRLVVFQIVFLKITLKTTNNSMPFFQCALLLSDILPPCSWSCLTLCSPVDCSPPGSSLHGNF